ncbi:MAG: bacteriohopanetetrol glucosamine biosynthesis glycosyltransferase HpnI [Bryobacteraceae bacterium]
MVWLLLAIVTGSLVYCVLIVIAARNYLQSGASRRVGPPISILKPLHGLDDGLESNLQTFFEQDYPDFEILFATRLPNDPALAIVDRLKSKYPHVPVTTLIVPEPPYPNAKVWSLDHMLAAAANDLVVMSDSDIRVTPAMLQTIAGEFADPHVAVATCPYRAVPGRGSFWSTLEAIGMNTEFWGSALVARLLEGMKFAVGPTIAARRQVIQAIGGFHRLKDYLAEDFVMGNFAAERGFGVILSRYVIQHHIGAQPWRANFAHRVRWNRSTRRSRPAGYAGQLFTNPLPLALLLIAVHPAWWPILAVVIILRTAAAYAVSESILNDPLSRRRWYLIPLQDILSFAFWIAGFFGNTITWRSRVYRLNKDGTFTLLPKM